MAQPTVKTYFAVWAALLLLLGATYLVGDKLELGPWNFVIALGIAVTKAGLIVLFFMHVRYSLPLIRLVACGSFFFLAILLGLALCDYLTRGWWHA
jgi:cytochrome c oxidase subunit IV